MSELLSFILSSEDTFKSKARLSSLYSDFARLKTTNPDGYRANVSAWTAALTRASRAGIIPRSSLLSIRAGDELARDLQDRTLGRPAALDAVFDEAVQNGDLIPLKHFLDSTTTIYKKPGWLPRLHIPTAWEVAQWSLRQLGIGRDTSFKNGELVVKANVEAASQAILKRLTTTLNTSTPSTCIYSLSTFTHAFSNALSSTHHLNSSDTTILLKHVSRDLNACTISQPDASNPNATTTIKFRSPNTTSPPAPITQQDTTLAHLSTLHLALTIEISALTTRIATLTASLQPLLEKSSTTPSARSTALSLLRRRKAINSTLEKRQSNLHQVEDLITSIDLAASNVEIMEAMKESTSVLRSLNEQVGGVEGVDNVMEALREEREKVEEVGSVITEGGPEAVDEEEVERELEALMGEERPKGVEDVEEKHAEEAKEYMIEKENTREQRQEEPSLHMPDVPAKEPAMADVGFRAVERPRRERSEDEMEKRLSAMSLDEEPLAGKENETETEKSQSSTEKQHADSLMGQGLGLMHGR